MSPIDSAPPSTVKWAVWAVIAAKIYQITMTLILDYPRIASTLGGFRIEVAISLCLGIGLMIGLFWWAILYGLWLGERWAFYIIQIMVLADLFILLRLGGRGQALFPLCVGLAVIFLLYTKQARNYFQRKALEAKRTE